MYGKLSILLIVFIFVCNDRVDGQMKKEVKRSTQRSAFIKFGCNFVAILKLPVSPVELKPEVMCRVKLVTRVVFKQMHYLTITH